MKRRSFVRRGAVALGGVAAAANPLISRVSTAAVSAGETSRATGRAADIVLRRALVYDGSGAAPRHADVRIAQGRIAEIAPRITAGDADDVDLDGLALAPGFIDIHSHTDLVLLRDPRADSKVRQGVTTEVAGQDGSSVGWTEPQFAEVRERFRADGVALDFRDVAGFLRYIDAHGAAVNVASMIGAGTIRAQVIGNADRPASSEEVARMVALVHAAIADGACGVSSGLEYTPGAFADAAELAALAAPLRPRRLPFASHIRNEDDGLLGAIEEVIGVGQRAAVPVQISHLKAQGERNWWKTDPALELLERARSTGIDVMFDVYPYEAYATALSNLFPVAVREGGTDAFLARLRDPAAASRIESAVRDKVAMLGSWDAVQLTGAGSDAYAWVAGKRLGRLAQERGVEPYALLLDIMQGDRARTRMVGFGMNEANVARKLAHPLAIVCSDGAAVSRADGVPHPRNYGTFPRVLGRFCRELKALPLEQAIAKMTSVPAQRLHFDDRGRIAVGAAADLVAFDPATVADRATFDDPHQFPAGIPHVLVNGVFVIRDGQHTAARPGRAVRPGTGSPNTSSR